MSEVDAAPRPDFVAMTARPLGRGALLVLAGVVIGLWLILTPSGLLGHADAIGYAVCHRIELRSFHLGDRALPLCARCTGMYLGVMVGLTYFAVRGRGRAGLFPSRNLLILFGIFGLAFAVDGTNSFLSLIPDAPQLYEPSNPLRLITGILLGLGLISVVYPSFNQSAWRIWRKEAPLDGIRDLLLLLLAAGLVVAAVLSENPLLLYPLAIISSVGVLVLLTSAYTILALLVMRRENTADSWMGMVFPVIAGFSLAMLQIGLLDFGRFILTGTWSGFRF